MAERSICQTAMNTVQTVKSVKSAVTVTSGTATLTRITTLMIRIGAQTVTTVIIGASASAVRVAAISKKTFVPTVSNALMVAVTVHTVLTVARLIVLAQVARVSVESVTSAGKTAVTVKTGKTMSRPKQVACSVLAVLWVWVLVALGIAVGQASMLCPTEDSTGCYWNAQLQGNGIGISGWHD